MAHPATRTVCGEGEVTAGVGPVGGRFGKVIPPLNRKTDSRWVLAPAAAIVLLIEAAMTVRLVFDRSLAMSPPRSPAAPNAPTSNWIPVVDVSPLSSVSEAAERVPEARSAVPESTGDPSAR